MIYNRFYNFAFQILAWASLFRLSNASDSISLYNQKSCNSDILLNSMDASCGDDASYCSSGDDISFSGTGENSIAKLEIFL